MKRLIAVLLITALFIISYDLFFLVFREVKKTTWHEVLLKNGDIVDGSGKTPYKGDILIRGEKIVAVGKNIAVKPGARVIDVNGAYLLPGFVEMCPGVLPQGEEQKKWITYGVTTLIGGDRGSSPVNLAGYLKGLADEKFLLNYGMLYGLDILPVENPGVIPSVAAEVLREGALGFSLDLEAYPNSWQKGEALGGLFQDISQDGEGRTFLAVTFPEEIVFQEELFLKNLSEILHAAEQFSIALHLRNFRLRSGAAPETIDTFKKELQAAVGRGTRLSGDLNPFHLSGDPVYTWKASERFSPDELFLAKAGAEKSLLGCSFAEAAASKGFSPKALGVQLELKQTGHEKEFVNLPFFCCQPVYAVSAKASQGLEEPRSCLWVFQEEGILGIDIEERVKKLTSLPAAFLGLAKRGILSPGNYADLLVIKKEENSCIVDYVFVNGKIVLAQGEFTDKSPGLFLGGGR